MAEEKPGKLQPVEIRVLRKAGEGPTAENAEEPRSRGTEGTMEGDAEEDTPRPGIGPQSCL